MPKIKLQRKTSYYERVIEEGKNSSNAPQYEAVCKELETLVATTKSMKNPEEKMSPKDYEDIKKKYRDVQEACRNYFAAELNSFEKSRARIIKSISNVLDKDIEALEACNPKQPGTLSEVMDKSRSHIIKLNSKDIKTVGAALSSRIPLKTHDDKKGFFTPKATYNIEEKWVEQIDKYKNIFPENCKSKMELLKNDETLQERFCKYCPPMSIEAFIEKNEDDPMIVENNIRVVAVVLGIADTVAKAKKMLSEDKELKEKLKEFMDAMAPMVNQRQVMAEAGIKKNANISNRNCAMTDIAQLLGCGNLLAKSVPLTVEIDGKKVDGVFMEHVEGTDINRLKEDDPIFKADASSFENPEVLRQMTDLQVVDFICGNVDRHMGNMIYQFENDENGKVVLKGIKGIDNDCSFGTPKIQKDNPIMSMVNPEKMQFIRSGMVKNIISLNKDMIEFKLKHYEFAQEEIDAIWDRVQAVKAAVRDKTMKVIRNDHWEKNTLSDTKTMEGNYLARIENMANECNQKVYATKPKGNNEIHYLGDSSTDKKVVQDKTPDIVKKEKRMDSDAEKKVMLGKVADIARLRKQMDDAKALFYNTSEYKLMKNQFERIEKLTNKIGKTDSVKAISDETAKELKSAYTELANKASKYIALKKLVPSQERGQKRLALAHDLMDFALDTLEEMVQKPEKEMKVEEKEQEWEIFN